ncbi:olfactory receptor 2K2-like [Gadus chalcogrammus]|uniref:olfactory receptor 2K2-like n=1 Tax=Gadus chalcogrammus TaxID=1042646 RepID=UPI0024C4B04D|nr:olfactory receptor 2K2-like [Gadus chalcogrammus]
MKMMMDNISMITVFSLSGLNEIANYRVVLFSSTLLYYCLILTINCSLILTIVLDKSLHEPMYILLCSLCINGIYGTTGFYPKFLLDLLSSSHDISYNGCLVQAFVMFSFACSDLSILSFMAYDRYLAICRPLHYHSVMNKHRLSQLVCFSWLTPFSILAINITLTSRLTLCSDKIQRLYCVNWVIVLLACPSNNTTVHSIVAYLTILVYVFHGLLIVLSYMYLVRTCRGSMENRKKFMQTCVPHLTCLLTFLSTIVFDVMYMRFGSKNIATSLQNFIAIEFLIIPPIMNPLIYGFKLTKVRNKILFYFNINRKYSQ